MEKGILTAIDANLNRTLEGLRVCEDLFRFNLHDRISEEIKSMRHRISALSGFVDRSKLLSARDVKADTQKYIDTPGEIRREEVIDVFRANIRRAAEALRALEEFSKLITSAVSAEFQHVRFEVYDIEQRGEALLLKSNILKKFNNSLYAIIDSAFVDDDKIQTTAEILADSGADIIQLRMKTACDKRFFEHASSVVSICRERGVLCIVNDRADIALLSKTHGVHLGQNDLPVSSIQQLSGDGFIIGITAGNLEEAENALLSSADYIAIGPVYSTSSKDGKYLNGIGKDFLKEICSRSNKPVAAIGGITSGNISEIIDTGCSCIAVISELYRDGKIAENTRRLKEIINKMAVNKTDA